MLKTGELSETIDTYLRECIKSHTRPTYKGIGRAIGASGMTIRNVNLGYYNGTPYGDKPSYNRRINNRDFDIIRNALKGAQTDA